jgi:hypothetical protein
MERPLALRVTLVALAIFAVFLLSAPIYRMGLWLEQPNEGWNAIHAINAFGGQLYPPRNGFLINNYPPLWFYLTGALARVFGDPIFPGRVVAFSAFLATGFAIYAILRQLNATGVAGLIAALSFIVIVAGLLGSYVGLSEPQMLAHALVAGGTAVLIGAKSRSATIVAALIVVTGLFVKHTVVALPLASAIWLLRFRYDRFWLWLITGLAAAAAALVLLLLIYGGSFAENIFFPRSFDLKTLGTNVALISKVMVPLGVYCIVAWRCRDDSDEAMAFAGAAIIAGLAVLCAFGSARGVSTNSVFDLVIGCAIGLGLAWDRLGSVVRTGAADSWRVGILAALMLRVGLGLSYGTVALPFDAVERLRLREQSAAMQLVRDAVKSTKDPVACETLSVCVWAGHVSTVDLWKLRHEATLGPFMDTGKLLARISDGEFGAIVTFGDVATPASDLHLAGLSGALDKGYLRPIRYSPYANVFIPKRNPDKN